MRASRMSRLCSLILIMLLNSVLHGSAGLANVGRLYRIHRESSRLTLSCLVGSMASLFGLGKSLA